MPTIYDVAKQAGVSPKTVSRVLNGDGPVNAETRQVVEAAMAELGYVRSNAARMMRATRSGLVGLVTGAISTSIDPTRPTGLPDLFIVQGVQAVLAKAGKTLMIADTAGRQDSVPGLMRTFLEHRVEGLIYVADHHKEIASPGVPSQVPLVLANCFDAAGTPAIIPDDRTGQQVLTESLIAAGHRRIAYVTLMREMVATRLRLQGYHDALAEAGIAADPALVAAGYREGYAQDGALVENAIDALLALDQPPTVICFGNDEMAMRGYGILRSRGLAIPDDISVAGYDDYRAIAETLFPPLTTVELAYRQLGEVAAAQLLARIEGQGDLPQQTLVPGPVRWRQSVRRLPD
ncbi:LacI family DNA-binding transcriptional regulator [uncultured Paracoccus sp.]|uniref:LacI family DNA-binding transcriptional regulator n=1 Tax=uncultured Paracoccus sp. TaxID=189685 RepID=UPI00262D3E14|nr:LacI family DNA-binding transcriptional regulator [uncultured Paracoccus sp.]